MNPDKNRHAQENLSEKTFTPTVSVQRRLSYLQRCSLHRVTSAQFPGKILSILERQEIPILRMVASSTKLSMIVKLNQEDFALILPLLNTLASTVFEEHIAALSISGVPWLKSLQLEKQIVESLGAIPILMISQKKNDGNLLLVIYDKDLEQALHCLRITSRWTV